MNAPVTRHDLDQVAVAKAFELLGNAEPPLADARALCFAIRTIAESDEVEKPADSALQVLADRIEAFLEAAEQMRCGAQSALHPMVFPQRS